MADKDTNHLCAQILHSHFGPLVSQVASILLTRGRLSMPQLVRASGLKPQTVRACILVLVQHNVLWHAETDDHQEVMEINTDECLARLRFGHFIWLAGHLFGQTAADIISILLDHGKLRLPDIHARMYVTTAKNQAPYTQMVHKLLTTSHIKPSTVSSHICPRDKLINYEAEEAKKKKGSILTAKDIRQAKEVAHARLRREEEEAEGIGLKRKAKEPAGNRTSKKQLVEEDVIDEDVYFRVNFAKFNVHIRNTLIESAVRERFNDAAALVLRATLQATEPRQLNVTDIRSDATTMNSLIGYLPEDHDLAAGFAYPSSSKTPSTSVLVKEYVGILSAADNPTPSGIASSFLSTTSAGSGKIQVEFDIIHRRLRRRVFEGFIREKFGDDTVRIVRIIMDNGKMDEKHIAKIAMKAGKDVRTLLVALSSASLVSLQEVAKGADRAPSRTFYLWFVDLPKVYAVLLRHFYKTQQNILARKRAEAEENTLIATILAKQERSDLRGDESLLTRIERETLNDWEEKRLKMTVLEMRVGEAVFVLKELSGLDTD